MQTVGEATVVACEKEAGCVSHCNRPNRR
jgi:hypothetical protein